MYICKQSKTVWVTINAVRYPEAFDHFLPSMGAFAIAAQQHASPDVAVKLFGSAPSNEEVPRVLPQCPVCVDCMPYGEFFKVACKECSRAPPSSAPPTTATHNVGDLTQRDFRRLYDPRYRCNNCFKIAPLYTKWKSCANCGRVRYCGRLCQKLGWASGHKNHCIIEQKQ